MNPAPGGGFGGFNFGQTTSFTAPAAGKSTIYHIWLYHILIASQFYTAPTTTSAPLSFALPQATQAAPGFSLGNPTASSAPSSFGTPTVTGGLSFGAKPPATPAAIPLTFGAAPSSAGNIFNLVVIWHCSF